MYLIKTWISWSVFYDTIVDSDHHIVNIGPF